MVPVKSRIDIPVSEIQVTSFDVKDATLSPDLYEKVGQSLLEKWIRNAENGGEWATDERLRSLLATRAPKPVLQDQQLNPVTDYLIKRTMALGSMFERITVPVNNTRIAGALGAPASEKRILPL
ncbi:hypothetical protein ACVWW4_003934 [Bradyrhizobium sp. LB7.1]